jgi:PPP family 3-phenylpropionic acid transporter
LEMVPAKHLNVGAYEILRLATRHLMSEQSLQPISPLSVAASEVQSARRGLIIARLYYFCFFAAIGAFVPFFNIFLEQRGLSGTQIGWLGSIPPLIALAAGPFWSGIADRWQIHRLVLTFCIAVAGIISVLFLQATTLPALLFLVIVLFFFRAPIAPLLDSAVVEMLPAVNASYGRQRLWGSVGFILATYGLGQLVNGGNLAWAFWIHGLLLTVACAGLSLFLPLPSSAERVDLIGGLRTMVGHAQYRGFLLACILLGIGAAGMMNFMGLYVLALGGTQAQVGLTFAVNALAEIPIMYAGGGWFARHGNARLALWGSIGFATVWTMMAFVQTPVQLIAVASLVGVSFGIFWIAAVGYAGEQAPKGMSATAQALMGAALFGLGWSLGALIAGSLWQWTNGHVLFGVMGGFGGVAAVILYRGRPV